MGKYTAITIEQRIGLGLELLWTPKLLTLPETQPLIFSCPANLLVNKTSPVQPTLLLEHPVFCQLSVFTCFDIFSYFVNLDTNILLTSASQLRNRIHSALKKQGSSSDGFSSNSVDEVFTKTLPGQQRIWWKSAE